MHERKEAMRESEIVARQPVPDFRIDTRPEDEVLAEAWGFSATLGGPPQPSLLSQEAPVHPQGIQACPALRRS